MSLQTQDPELYSLIQDEKTRQETSIELIASENFTSPAVLECLGSILVNKYSEGLPGKRYYGGNEVVDKIENLCIQRCLEAYNLDPEVWGVNVQPYSGSPANLAVYMGILSPGDTICGLGLTSGGHLTHGYQTPLKKITASSMYYNTVSYHVDANGWLDMSEVEKTIVEANPKLIICGASAYPRDFDYSKFREIADLTGAYLMCDMAHISGLIASGVLSSPFEHCDIVTTTTHKTLRGPRAGLIFFRKKFEKAINEAVFPGLQGGPHQNQIAGIACQMREVCTQEYKDWAKQVVLNARALSDELIKKGYKVMTDGTDNHIVLVNLKNKGITGSKIEKICERVSISINKNTVAGDVSALSPSGIRLGTPAMTTKGMREKDFREIARVLDTVITLALKIQSEAGKKLDEFVQALSNYEEALDTIKSEVQEWCKEFNKVQ